MLVPVSKKALLILRDANGSRGKLVRAGLRRRPEALEPRTLLSADPIEFGAVYVEHDLGSDAHPDTLEITFVGGVTGTQLTRFEIDGDKFTPGLSLADMLFDTQAGGLGADLAFDGLVTIAAGDFTYRITVEDGSSRVWLELGGFEAGEKLLLSIDVDEMQGFEPKLDDLAAVNDEIDPIASGAEFQGSRLTAYFSAPHHYDAEASVTFQNHYDDELATTQLDLPRDDAAGNRDRTAGAVGQLQQSPLPISLAGMVFEDRDADLERDTDDRGLVDVRLSLFIEQDGAYVFTGHTATTDDQGAYAFDASLGLLPGTYQLRETQPSGYFSVGAIAGTVDGVASGLVQTDDILTMIDVPHGGAVGQQYNFAEARPASIRGAVHLSTREGDCFSEDEQHRPLAGVKVLLLDATGESIADTVTDAEGRYAFEGLRPDSMPSWRSRQIISGTVVPRLGRSTVW